MSLSRGGKRQASSPVGASFKDPRREGKQQSSRFDVLGDYESDGGEWTEVNNGKRQTQTNEDNSSSAQPTFASVTAQGPSNSQDARNTQSTRKVLERIFKTAPPDGPMRDTVTVEIRQVNGVPFKGSLHFKEAKYGIFENCLKMDPTTIHGLSFGYSDYPIVKYKLKHQIDIDSLKPLEYFEFNRSYKVNGMNKTDILQCKVKGIRSNYSNQIEESDSDPNIRWVKIEWIDYELEEHEILAWLEQFGEPLGHLTEEIYPDSDSDGDPTGNGTFTVKMKLHSPIPQLLPMWGKRIRIYYRGVQKLCSRCFGNHPRRNCRSEKRRWVDYVLEFMEHYQDIPNEIYGRWYKVINEEFGEVIDGSTQEKSTEPENATDNTETNARRRDSSSNSHLTAQKPRKPAFVSKRTQPAQRTDENTNSANDQATATRTNRINRDPRVKNRLTQEEEENLSDYLSLGMTIAEARESFKKEIEMAELREKIRENRRNANRGDINSSTRTQIGITSPNRGRGRGGLSFN